MFFFLCAAGLASGLPNVDTPLRTGNRAPHDAAVVIGIEDYAFVVDVPHAAKDAEAFYDLLVYTVGIPSDHVRLMNGGASREQILAAIDTAAGQVGERGTVWVYFAGHGAADSSTGARMLLGDDVRQDPTVFDSRGVGVDELVERVKGADLRLITDACYGGRGRSGQDIVSGMRFAVPSYATSATAKELFWYAAAGDQLAGPLEEVGHGAFTYLAIGALRGWADGEVDGQRDGQVTAEEAQLFVGRAMRTLQIVGQQPEMSVADGSGEVLLASGALEEGPSFDARSGRSEEDSPSVSPPGQAPETVDGRLDPHNREAVMDRVQALVDDCVQRHPPYARTWSVKARFSPKGNVAPVVMASLQSQGTTTMQISVNPVATCIGQGIRAFDFVPPEQAVSVNGSYTAR